jgi:C4-dicarboxylate-specific signal transduction histidine kinase
MAERILVVDDDPRNRRLLDAMLRPEGYAVLEAESGEKTLELIGQGAADLVLLDVMMPGLDGVETLRRIRSSPGPERLLPVIFVTALGDRDSRVRGKSVGADDYLAKPIDTSELLARVRNLLDAKAYHDLRERQRQLLEQELERRQVALVRAERLATLGTLAGGVGHELNNICAVFLGTMHFVQENATQGRPPEADDLVQLLRVGEHLRVHADHLLSLGRPGPDHAESLDLRDIVTSTIGMLRTTGRAKYVEVESYLPESPVQVTINRTRIEQVVLNLVGNAVDATLGRDDPRVRVIVAPPDDAGYVGVRVEDNGSGISTDQLELIFEPYFTTKPPGRGTGLGLVVVKQIVEGYGGKLHVQSTLGAGSVFAFELPSEKVSRSSSRRERPTLPPSLGGRPTPPRGGQPT